MQPWEQRAGAQPPARRYLSVPDIFLLCERPDFNVCGTVCGCATCCFSGLGLFCFPCYGAKRPDCLNVVISGLLMELTNPCVWGWVAACIVGWRMICRL